MSNKIPKEQQTAYQRWEMASFDEPVAVLEVPAPTAAEIQANEDEIARLYQEAHDKGYRDGLAEGLTTGLEEGRAIGLEEGRVDAARELAALQQIAQRFSTEVAQASDTVAEDLLTLALDVAKAMLKTVLIVRPEIVLPIIGEAIRYLPSLQQPAVLFVNAEDAQLIKDHLGDELDQAGWRVAEDVHMERGGCRIDTASNQIDATVSTRWQRITTALGKESTWLEP